MHLQNLVESIAENRQAPPLGGLVGTSAPYTIARLFLLTQKPLCVLLPNQKMAEQFAEDLSFFLGDQEAILFFPSFDVFPYYGLSPSPSLTFGRVKTLHALRRKTTSFILVTSVAAFRRKLPPIKWMEDFSFSLRVGGTWNLRQLQKSLLEIGYQDVPVVEDIGSFSRRAGIFDIFPPHFDAPLRIEFFGDEIESMRQFDPNTQRSKAEVGEAEIIPAGEILWDLRLRERALRQFRQRADHADLPKPKRSSFVDPLKEGIPPPALETFIPLFYDSLTSLFDYLPSQALLVQVETQNIKSHWEEQTRSVDYAYDCCQTLEKLISPKELFLTWEEFSTATRSKKSLMIDPLGSDMDHVVYSLETHHDLRTLIKAKSMGEHFLDPLKERLGQWQKRGLKILMLASSHPQALRLEDLLERLNFNPRRFLGSFSEFLQTPVSHHFFIKEAHLSGGFVWEQEGFVLITDEEVFGKKVRAPKSSKAGEMNITSFEELTPGRYIVHADHGVGLYRDLVSLELEGIKNDFLLLEYLGGDKLYLPVYRMNLVSTYFSDHVPALDKLGGFSWGKTVSKVKKSIKAMAADLLRLYAERASLKGFSFHEGGVEMEEFEAAFPYEETEDQLRVIKEVTKDMTHLRPMDRLICGDVGFGKTEVAMRAAYQAVLNGKQVVVIVPTTVLAQQHFQSFKERFRDTPVVIEMLSRFVGRAQQKEIIKRLQEKKLDILIGTHRLFSSDVSFKDLGLLIIDEEHRFGVAQKEKMKQIKKQVDVLSMTATPIPRTLNMSLSGIRDLSIINTPPKDRLSIRTFVSPYNEALIREAILREISRGGQVYFVHNKVQTIHKELEKLRKIVPEATLGMGHGQMNERELENVMIKFVSQEMNVLVCTTIIESGLDVPRANTIIMNRADQLGLAQLYQLRGRVGRSNVRAYAYLLTPERQNLSKDARARLSVIQRYTDLGSGFKIAAHDMEIRGVGNFLGDQQSGHIAAVGYEMYTHLLEEAVLELKGQEIVAAPEPELKLKLTAFIPENYVAETTLRLTLYKRLAMAGDVEILAQMGEEMKDRFGKHPDAVVNLLKTMTLKILAKKAWIRLIKQETRRMVLAFDQNTPLNFEELGHQTRKEPGRFQWISPTTLAMGFKEGKIDQAYSSLQKFLIGLCETEIGQ